MVTPPTTIQVTDIAPCGDGKVCITMKLVVDVHRLVDVSSELLSVAIKDAASKKE